MPIYRVYAQLFFIVTILFGAKPIVSSRENFSRADAELILRTVYRQCDAAFTIRPERRFKLFCDLIECAIAQSRTPYRRMLFAAVYNDIIREHLTEIAYQLLDDIRIRSRLFYVGWRRDFEQQLQRCPPEERIDFLVTYIEHTFRASMLESAHLDSLLERIGHSVLERWFAQTLRSRLAPVELPLSDCDLHASVCNRSKTILAHVLGVHDENTPAASPRLCKQITYESQR